MSYALLNSYNLSDGINTIFVYVNDITSGLFINMLLFLVFMVFTLGFYFGQRRSSNDGDLPLSLSAGSFLTTAFAILLSLTSGLVSSYIILLLIFVSVMSVIWLFFSNR